MEKCAVKMIKTCPLRWFSSPSDPDYSRSHTICLLCLILDAFYSPYSLLRVYAHELFAFFTNELCTLISFCSSYVNLGVGSM